MNGENKKQAPDGFRSYDQYYRMVILEPAEMFFKMLQEGRQIAGTIPEFQLGSSSGSVGHGINTYMGCPKCGGYDFEVRKYDMMWHDGEVWCVPCNVYVRGYDAG